VYKSTLLLLLLLFKTLTKLKSGSVDLPVTTSGHETDQNVVSLVVVLAAERLRGHMEVITSRRRV